MRTCTGCGAIAPQRELVRLVFSRSRLVVDPSSEPSSVARPKSAQRLCRLPGRGAYVHANPACVTAAGLSRSFRRQVRPGEVARIAAEMSPIHDNSSASGLADRSDEPLQNASQNDPGLEDGDTVEMPPRIKAKDDRSEDARL